MAAEYIQPTTGATTRLTTVSRAKWHESAEALPKPLQQAEQFINNRVLSRSDRWQLRATAALVDGTPNGHSLVMVYQSDRPPVTRRLNVPHPEQVFLDLNHIVQPRYIPRSLHQYGESRAWHDRRLELPDTEVPPFLHYRDPKIAEVDPRYAVANVVFEPSYGMVGQEAIDNIFVQNPPDLFLLPEHPGFLEVRLNLVDYATANHAKSDMLRLQLSRDGDRMDDFTRASLEQQLAETERKTTELVKHEDLFKA